MKNVRILALAFCLMMCINCVPQQTWAATTVQGSATKVAKVTGLAAGVTTVKSINIRWKPIAGVSGYEIFRANAKDGKYTCIKKVVAGSQAFCNITVQTGKEYHYKVRGFVTKGKANSYGKFSKVLRANTKPFFTKNVAAKASTNVRKQPGTQYERLLTVTRGTKMKVLCEAEDAGGSRWYRVQLTINKKKCTGYVRSDLVS